MKTISLPYPSRINILLITRGDTLTGTRKSPAQYMEALRAGTESA
jgi:hypothetical protein